MDASSRTALATGADPALVAFVKCHLSSFLRWDVLRTLATAEGRWSDLESVAASLHKPLPAVRHTLEDLAAEGVVEEQFAPTGGLLVRLNPDDPTTRVVGRLIASSSRDQFLRQLIVARILSGDQGAA